MMHEQQEISSGRRTFIKNSLMISVGFMGLRYFSGMPAFAGIGPRLYDRYGPLLNDPDGVFNLPKDFSYKIISRSGAPMDDGFLSPGDRKSTRLNSSHKCSSRMP